MSLCGWRLRRAHDVFDRNSADGERVGNERTMTTPRNRFGAHDGDLLLPGQFDEFLQGRLEFWRLHVIGESAEARVAPAGIDRILLCVSKSAQRLHVPVTDPDAAELAPAAFVIELRIVTRARNCPHVHQLLDPVRFQHRDEFIQRMRRMADGHDERRFAGALGHDGI